MTKLNFQELHKILGLIKLNQLLNRITLYIKHALISKTFSVRLQDCRCSVLINILTVIFAIAP